MASAEGQDALITQFCSLTGVSPTEAQQYLATNQWDLSSAAAEYYTSLEEGAVGGEEEEDAQEPESIPSTRPSAPTPSGGRTLGDAAPVPQTSTDSSAAPPSSTSSKQPPKKKFATLGDLGGGSSGHAGHGHDDDDDSDDEENQDLFAGGEKSALAVQNPDDLKRKIKEKARKNQARTRGDDPQPAPSRFTGTARTLGGDDTPSQVIEDPSAVTPQRAPTVERILHFWADGFSVDDGPLYRSDDPANTSHLAMIRQGRAPLEIMNVERNQEVDVKLIPHEEKYVQPKKKYKPFGGGGQRLGSETPGAGSDPSPATVPTPVDSPAAATSSVPTVDVNDSQPTLSLQIRLGDGTRLSSRFNTTHTIGDVYSFVQASSPASRTRPWVLMTTFPSKELSDKAQPLGDLAEFKRGGVVVQKWS